MGRWHVCFPIFLSLSLHVFPNCPPHPIQTSCCGQAERGSLCSLSGALNITCTLPPCVTIGKWHVSLFHHNNIYLSFGMMTVISNAWPFWHAQLHSKSVRSLGWFANHVLRVTATWPAGGGRWRWVVLKMPIYHTHTKRKIKKACQP